jgi:4-carboxymuconolactone decarboxylase
MASFTDKGEPAPSQYFAGLVRVNMNITSIDGYNIMIGTVVFEPGGRTNWHTHSSGQILFVTEGTGYYQEKGQRVQVIKKGDVIKIPKNAEHWHGASHNSTMMHIAVVPELDKDNTEWLNPVTDEDYDSVLLHSEKQFKDIRLTNAAIQNHEELWPGYVSKALQTDPDLIEVFDNFAFDEVISHGNLDTKTRILVIMASTIACQSLTEYKMYVNAALNTGIKPEEIKEVLYQSVPYVGISKVIDFIYATNEVFTERGIVLPLKSQSETSRETRFESGLAVQKSIFGERIDKMYEQSPKNQIHFQKFLSDNCFGDYITRKGMDIKIRELLTYSMLISMGGAESQVKGHITGNINVGNTKEILISVTTQLLPYIGYPRTLNALNCLNEVLPETGS